MAGVCASADGEHRQELDLGVTHRHRGIGIAPVDRIGEAPHVPLGLGSHPGYATAAGTASR